MTKINNQEIFPVDTTITGNESVIGSDNPTSQKPTRNYLLSDIRDWIASTIEGFEQNNKVITVPVQAVDSVTYDLAAKVNAGEIDWEYSPIAGNNGQVEILDTWNVIFRVPVSASNGNQELFYFDYYLLMDQGKGTIGLSSGVTLTESNFQKLPSSAYLSLPSTDGSLEPPVVYTISAQDITNPEQVLNQQSAAYVIDASASDFYFVMQEEGVASGDEQTDYKVYRFVGANGTYGNGGVGSTAVPSDFVLVDSSILSQGSGTPRKKPRIRRVIIPEVIAPTGDDILQALLRSDLEQINHIEDEVLLFQVVRQLNVNDDQETSFAQEQYYWAGALGVVNGGAETTLDNFVLDYVFSLTDAIIPVIATSAPTVNSIGTPDISLPEVAVNDSPDSYNIDGTSDFLFLVFDNDTDSRDFKIYRFTGAVTGTGTYGNGGAKTAVNGDFEEINQNNPSTGGTMLWRSVPEGDLINAYYGTRLIPAGNIDGTIINANRNKSIGYFARNINSGNAAYAGFIASVSGTDFEGSVSLQRMGSGYSGYLQDAGIMYSADGDMFYVIGVQAKDHIFRTGTSASPSTSATQEVFRMEDDGTISAPLQTIAKIIAKGNRAVLTKEYFDSRSSNFVKVTVLSAELLAIQSSPKTLVAAQGANTVVKIKSIIYSYNYGTINYGGGTSLDVIYTGASIIASNGIDISGGGSRIHRDVALTAPTGGASVANQAVVLSDGLNATGGDGTLDLWIEYIVMDVS